MAYRFYLNRILLPVTPSAVSIQSPNRNEIIDLIDGSQINILKEPGLEEITFDFLIPQTSYPFADYGPKGFQKAEFYIEQFKKLRASKKPFQFIILRAIETKPVSVKSGQKIDDTVFQTNLKVSIEDFQHLEDADANGLDLKFSITLRESPEYGTKEFKLDKDTGTATPEEPERPVEPTLVVLPTQRKTYTVKSGDSLWAICARELGSGSKCMAVAAKNGIANPDLIQPGQVLDLTGV